MAGRRNKNAFKCVLQVLILSQTQPLGIKNVVWGGLEVVWGVLGCFHGPAINLQNTFSPKHVNKITKHKLSGQHILILYYSLVFPLFRQSFR